MRAIVGPGQGGEPSGSTHIRGGPRPTACRASRPCGEVAVQTIAATRNRGGLRAKPVIVGGSLAAWSL